MNSKIMPAAMLIATLLCCTAHVAAKTSLKAGVVVYSGNPATDALLNSGKFEEAETRCMANLKRKPADVQSLIGAGWAQAKLFKLDAANVNFEKALANRSSNPIAHIGKALVIVNRLQSSSNTIIKNRTALLQQAEAECNIGIATDSKFPEGHWVLSMILKEQGRIDQAINEFRTANNLDGNYADGFSGLGMALLDKNDLVGATQAATKAIGINSKNSTAHYVRGEVFRRQNRLDEALAELNTALYQNRNSGPVHLSMGKTLASQGNSVGAVKEFQDSVRIKAENPDAYLGIADIRESRGDFEVSISELRSAAEMLPNNAALRIRIADESLHVDKFDDAIKEYQAALALLGNDSPTAAKGLSRAYYLKANKEATGAFFVSNEFESAKRNVEQALKLYPNDMELRLAQAKIRSLSGEAVDLNTIGTPRNDGERIAYAEACLAQNKFKEADEQLRAAISNASDMKQTFAVADLCLMVRDLANAEAAYKKGGGFAGGSERSSRGLSLVAKQRDLARQDLTLANDLASKSLYKSSLDKYRSAISGDPKVSDAHLGYAVALQKDEPETAEKFRQAATQYRAYLSLEPDLPLKEVERINERIQRCLEKALKREGRSDGRRRHDDDDDDD